VALAEVQEPVCMAPRHAGPPDRSSLICESDTDYTKPGTDILLHAHAHAPNSQPVRELEVGFQVAGLTKRLRVTGPRFWEQRGGTMRPSAPEPFMTMPIAWEHAFGGWAEDDSAWDQRNPAGTGIARQEASLFGRPAPHIETWNDPVIACNSASTPGGFGPIARHWLPRARYAGTYDADWEESRAPLLPADFDERFFHAAPEDQQLAAPLNAPATMRLLHLTPEPVVEARLPRLAIGLTTLMGRETIHHRPALRTILVEAEQRRIIMVWHDALPCHGRKYQIARTEIIAKPFLQ
jgi:hypothetical protein